MYKGLLYITMSASARRVSTYYLSLSYFCTLYSVLQRNLLGSTWKEAWDFSTQDVNHHTDTYKLLNILWPVFRRHLQDSPKFPPKTLLDQVARFLWRWLGFQLIPFVVVNSLFQVNSFADICRWLSGEFLDHDLSWLGGHMGTSLILD